MEEFSKSEINKIKQRILKGTCACGCGNIPNFRSLFIYGHQNKTYKKLPENQKKELKLLRRSKCLCGCGTLVYKKWEKGHWRRGVNGWAERFRNKKFSDNKEGRGVYPSEKEIIDAHFNFLQTLKIDENKCWGCQRNSILEKCHIQAYSDNGDNSPKNLILLCSICHNFQHLFSFRISEWDLKKQYKWIRMMNEWKW